MGVKSPSVEGTSQSRDIVSIAHLSFLLFFLTSAAVCVEASCTQINIPQNVNNVNKAFFGKFILRLLGEIRIKKKTSLRRTKYNLV